MNTHADSPADGQAITSAHTLTALQHQFPRYLICQETTCGRVRYVARSLEQGLRPHTVITADLAELQAALEPSQYAELMPGRPTWTMTRW